jgi:hypothetical protein
MTGVLPDLTAPHDGASDVALDSAVVVEVSVLYGTGGCDPLSGPGKFELSVTPSAGGASVAGNLEGWNPSLFCSVPGSAFAALAWRPVSPFDAGASYDLDVTFTPYGAAPLVYATTFVAGTQFLPEVVLDGTLTATTSVMTRSHNLCMQPDGCGAGGGCVTTQGTEVIATLSGLSATGGQAAQGYDVFLETDVDAPPNHPVSYPLLHASDKQHFQLETALPDVGGSYTPCFSVFVEDAAGHMAGPSSFCLPALDPGELIAEAMPDAASDAGSTPSGEQPSAATAESGGCSASHRGSSSVVLFGFVLSVCASTRRRRKNGRSEGFCSSIFLRAPRGGAKKLRGDAGPERTYHPTRTAPPPTGKHSHVSLTLEPAISSARA